jgi:protein phosphatase-4 regulatory subunit 3
MLYSVALKFFRTLISLQDTFYQALMTHNNTFGLILDIVYETMPRDNLLNSACLELFEFIKRENIKPFILHVVEKYREKLENITYVDTFQNLILRYDQMQGYGAEADSTLFSQDDGTPRRMPLNGQRWQGVKELDAAEEEYFNTSDDEDEVSFVKITQTWRLADVHHSGPKRIVVLWLLAWPTDLLLQWSSRWLIILTMTMKMPWTLSPSSLQISLQKLRR